MPRSYLGAHLAAELFNISAARLVKGNGSRRQPWLVLGAQKKPDPDPDDRVAEVEIRLEGLTPGRVGPEQVWLELQPQGELRNARQLPTE